MRVCRTHYKSVSLITAFCVYMSPSLGCANCYACKCKLINMECHVKNWVKYYDKTHFYHNPVSCSGDLSSEGSRVSKVSVAHKSAIQQSV